MVTKPNKRPFKAVQKSRIGGVDVVTIPATLYAELLAGTPHGARPRRYAVPPSPIERNPALASFIAERLGKMGCVAIADACRQAFEAPTPSKSAISRYAARLSAADAAKPEESR